MSEEENDLGTREEGKETKGMADPKVEITICEILGGAHQIPVERNALT